MKNFRKNITGKDIQILKAIMISFVNGTVLDFSEVTSHTVEDAKEKSELIEKVARDVIRSPHSDSFQGEGIFSKDIHILATSNETARWNDALERFEEKINSLELETFSTDYWPIITYKPFLANSVGIILRRKIKKIIQEVDYYQYGYRIGKKAYSGADAIQMRNEKQALHIYPNSILNKMAESQLMNPLVKMLARQIVEERIEIK